MAPDADLKSLIDALSWWERVGYLGLSLVIIGVVGEGIHDFTSWFMTTWWSSGGGRASVLILIAGLAIEGIGQVNVNSTSEQLVALETKETAALKLEITRLKSSRFLNPQQQDEFVTVMRPFAGQRISFGALPPTFEALAFADQLVELLKRAGVNAEMLQEAAVRWIGPAHGVVARYISRNARRDIFVDFS